MGGYGALNLGTKRAELFSTIASLGGPVDLERLIEDDARESPRGREDVEFAIGRSTW